MASKRLRLHFTGIVQGVGFRPHIYRLATDIGLSGFVCNQPDGVRVEIEGPENDLHLFVAKVGTSLPAPAVVKTFTRTEIDLSPNGEGKTFQIRESPVTGVKALTIGADLATCPACLAEMNDPGDRRFGYPFINCTDCGPRLTIVRDLPYDRRRTAMAPFTLCRECLLEYNDPASRRFHAEATACPQCGPQLILCNSKGEKLAEATALALTRELLKKGKIIALKGLGGFHLAVAADNHEAVIRLRRRKNRACKPLAIMVKDLATAEKLAHINQSEKALLLSPARPIVLLAKNSTTGDSHRLSAAVAPKIKHYGIMLPYTPLHHLLFAEGIEALVMTSANFSDEPICIDNHAARQRLEKIADCFLLHNRDILVRLDDSVAMVVNRQTRLLRRSRGYVPQSLTITPQSSRILALGGQMKSSLCLTADDRALFSPHIGDLETPEARDFLHENINLLKKIANCEPDIIACDLHPGYYSTSVAEKLSAKTLIKVQHHHAHIVSCMADNRLSGPVLGLVMDGTGYGTDGRIWGGEFLAAEEKSFTRLGQLTYFPLPGGELAIREPWRCGLSLLQQADPDAWLKKARSLKFVPQSLSDRQLSLIMQQSINNPLTSSLGRFFDGVAAILGFSQKITYEGQAAIELEALAAAYRDHNPQPPTELLPWTISDELQADGSSYCQLSLLPMVEKIAALSLSGNSGPALAALFHDSLIFALMTTAKNLCRRHNLDRIVLSGGCFQNRLLLQGCEQYFANSDKSITVFSHRQVPTNDGGLALGQALIAAHSKDFKHEQ
ncbi:MAG: carbamoyltransferase HypF [Deltaproteobacteria bacterium]|nr:carbamoyltransferase HypF [Deltaproteobacteria bacterium]